MHFSSLRLQTSSRPYLHPLRVLSLLCCTTTSFSARRLSVLAFVRPSFASGRTSASDPLGRYSAAQSSSQRSKMTTWNKGKPTAMDRCILPLSEDSHKGSSGRIAVLGGSAKYTGAPYYAAMATLKVGADLAYILTAQEAANPIKCYSPELMVAPVYCATEFDERVNHAASGLITGPSNETIHSLLEKDARAQQLVADMVRQTVPMLERLHCLIVGPGLGRCPLVMMATARILQYARQQNLALVLDADALYMLSSTDAYRTLLEGYDRVILTPNAVEYKRLFPFGQVDAAFSKATIVQKGKHDAILHDGEQHYSCQEPGGLKRSGGIGDVLAGTLGTLTAWQVILDGQRSSEEAPLDLPLSCWTACCFVKRATKAAFASHGRSMTAPDVLDQLGHTVVNMIDQDAL